MTYLTGNENKFKKDSHVVSVIIPTIGRPELNLCKNALDKQSRPPDEVIVVEDYERRGEARARNEGIRRSRGDLIAFLDDDCVPGEEWLEHLINAIDAYDAAGVGGTYQETDRMLNYIRLKKGYPKTVLIDEVGWVCLGGNVMYRRTVLESLLESDGYMFNESFKISDDSEIAWRLRCRGNRLVFVPTIMKHLKVLTPSGFLKHQFYRGTAVADLYHVLRSLKTKLFPFKSKIWGEESKKGWAKWLVAFWYKVVGPFDMRSFASKKDFWVFWVGEKVQGLGFVWKMIRHLLGDFSSKFSQSKAHRSIKT